MLINKGKSVNLNGFAIKGSYFSPRNFNVDLVAMIKQLKMTLLSSYFSFHLI